MTAAAVFFNNSIEGADSITVTGSTVNLGQYINADMPELNGRGNFDMVTDVKLTNSILNLHNNYYDRINLKNYRSEGDSFLNVNIGYHNGAWDADKMTVAGDIIGETQVIVYALTDKVEIASVVFVEAPNDTIQNPNAFSVYRVYGSPYMWTAQRNIYGDENGGIWYLTMNDILNPDYDGRTRCS